MKKYSDAQKVMEVINSKSLCTNFTKNVLIIHQDGSCMLFTHAFMFRYELWLLVLTEHQRNHIFHINDLHSYVQFGCREKLNRVDDNGDFVTEIACSRCSKVVNVNHAYRQYDEHGNMEEEELCEECFDLNLE